jgi:hypothetical protein
MVLGGFLPTATARSKFTGSARYRGILIFKDSPSFFVLVVVLVLEIENGLLKR